MAVRIMRYGVTETDNSIISHNLLVDRQLPNQHTIEAISGLRLELESKYVKPTDGIPIEDMGYNPATKEGMLLLQEEVNNRMTVIDSDIQTTTIRVQALEDFLNNIYQDESSGVPKDAVLKFAYREGFREEFISQENDTTFFLLNTFVADGKHLEVFRDGELLTPNVDYIEASDNKVVFNYPLEDGMYIAFICSSMSTVVSPIHEEVIGVLGQLTFTLKNSYKVGDNSLSIFANGLRLEKGKHYKEIDSNTFKLLSVSYPPGTKLICRQEGLQSAGQILYHEKDYQQKTWKIDLTATQDQQTFVLSETYIPGANMINVTVDGLLQWLGDDFDYSEIDDKTIKFNYTLDAGEKVSVTCIAALFNWRECFVSLEGQDTFELTNVYYTGRNDIVVYENGIQLEVGDDYLEISNRAIQFIDKPPKGAKITVFKRR